EARGRCRAARSAAQDAPGEIARRPACGRDVGDDERATPARESGAPGRRARTCDGARAEREWMSRGPDLRRSGRLLLAEAVQRAEADDEVLGADGDDDAVGEQLLEQLEGDVVARLVEGRDED